MAGRFTMDESSTSHNPELHITFSFVDQNGESPLGEEHAEASDRLCGEFQPEAQAVWASISKPV